MKTFFSRSTTSLSAAALAIVLCLPAFPGPGAHGPGGEHLEGTAGNAAGGTARPRVETKSELFELVGYLGGGELSIMINRFETNEPVLDAKVEVARGGAKATAKFHSDHGDYAIDDPAFLKTLSASGEHPLIFTVIAGSDSDLLEGTLTVTAAQALDHHGEHGHALEYGLIAGAGVLGLLGVAALWRRRVRSRMSAVSGGAL